MKRSFEVLYEDKELLAVFKRSGLLTIATDQDATHNLYHYVRDYLNRKKQKVFVVHRLDKDTSGIVLFAKTFDMKERLQEAFADDDLDRLYEAVVRERIPLGKTFRVDQFLSIDEKTGNVFVTHDKSLGKEAITEIEATSSCSSGTVLAIRILTGRKNQIRLALASLDLTLIGDRKYADNRAFRMMLNEYALIFDPQIGLRQSVFETTPLWLPRNN
jgi:23S rRNA pseudouridine1911/1915/1917 synthase